ncbi:MULTISPECIES: type II toxin-antitoxin system VapC family toxin [Roseofilum]|uniref:Type II toxin-antitoxin system VapC family toxin n=2 Tax=Roseofilum TaxID=1233426 RepID=A0ABT7BB44_9CYAN|nr:MULTISPECIES: type II toxin-antitoxin system VapC family toxin [Roseofilum]MDJ1168025.1 type II toxin-antitoxin system VapC family toxin [Roseofilum acuticapitatum BLCC-M154]MDJ1176399.1 type II toxin-antitoxin system VapC family toxin [Roseofilum capinflatum BLCC-M114]
MQFLVDTHALLWFFTGNANLSDRVRNWMEDSQHQKLISVASAWEITIKQSQQKLTLPMTAADYIQEKIQWADFDLLPIDLNHFNVLYTLPFHHRDPFDRLLIAQAINQNIPILSKDKAFDSYPVQRYWN